MQFSFMLFRYDGFQHIEFSNLKKFKKQNFCSGNVVLADTSAPPENSSTAHVNLLLISNKLLIVING